MDFVNETKLEAGWTLGFEPDGRELLVVAAKGTFSIRPGDGEPPLAEMQVPLTKADEFSGDPGFSATLYETDYAHRKPYCDVLLNGSAHAPGGSPAKGVRVGLHVGAVNKVFDVFGDRVWQGSAASTHPSDYTPFTEMPITYDRAYGGVDVDPDNPDQRNTYVRNPVGVGYYPLSKGEYLVGKPLPNTSEAGLPVEGTKGSYQPMSLGPIGRNFGYRIAFAGTYNQQWMDQQAPFWPADFDPRYFQAAPADQQMSYPRGGERVVLKNLTPAGVTSFRLSSLVVPVLFVPHRAEAEQVQAVVDTIVIEPTLARFMLTWRVSKPLRRNCFELREIVVGGRSRSWHTAQRAAAAGKRYYRNLDELIKERQGQTA
jgi:hypothetical protein